jgi:hypothetical protein
MAGFISAGYFSSARFQTVEESMRYYCMDPSSKYWRKEFAFGLLAGDFVVPQELRGDEVSRNGTCEWHKIKAFTNLYRHGVSFEEASLAFDRSLHPGYGVVYADLSDDGDGLIPFWGVDIRDKVIARLPGGNCFMVKIDQEYISSGRARLLSAQWASEKAVLKALEAHEKDPFVSVLARVAFASVGWSLSNRRNRRVRANIHRRIQDYERLRRMLYMPSL